MKRILAIILLILTLISCGEGAALPEDEYVYTGMRTNLTGEREVVTPARFNPKTGTLTPLCADPLCSHDKGSGCPFEGFGGAPAVTQAVIDNKVYYMYDDSVSEREIRCYDIENNSVETVLELAEVYALVPEGVETGSYSWQILFGYIYVDISSKESHLISAVSARYDIKTGVLENLGADNTVSDRPFMEYKGKYLYSNREKGGKYTGLYIADNRNGEGKTPIFEDVEYVLCYGGLLDEDIFLYSVYNRDENGKTDLTMTLYAYDIAKGTTEVVMNPAPEGFIHAYDGGLYFCLRDENPELLGYDENQREKAVYNTYGGKVWRRDVKTGELTLAFEAPGYVFRGYDMTLVGDYLVIAYTNTDYSHYIPHSVGVEYETEEGRIVYDLKRGEFAIYPEN